MKDFQTQMSQTIFEQCNCQINKLEITFRGHKSTWASQFFNVNRSERISFVVTSVGKILVPTFNLIEMHTRALQKYHYYYYYYQPFLIVIYGLPFYVV